jgi:hypothetical protein
MLSVEVSDTDYEDVSALFGSRYKGECEKPTAGGRKGRGGIAVGKKGSKNEQAKHGE